MFKFAAPITSRIYSASAKLIHLTEPLGSVRVKIGQVIDLNDAAETADDLERIGCPLSATAFRRLANDGEKYLAGVQLAERISQMALYLDEELGKNLFFWVPSNRAPWFNKTSEELLGDQCLQRFGKSGIGNEIIHAAKCFTFGEFTAAAFHLMRITEAGVFALARGIGNPIDETKNWGKFFKQFDQQSAVDPRNRTGKWKLYSSFLDDAGANLRAVKNAWRNPTMHLEKQYDEEQSEQLMRAVPAFMKHLASHLNEAGKFFRR